MARATFPPLVVMTSLYDRLVLDMSVMSGGHLAARRRLTVESRVCRGVTYSAAAHCLQCQCAELCAWQLVCTGTMAWRVC
jgi:hypothetical protein